MTHRVADEPRAAVAVAQDLSLHVLRRGDHGIVSPRIVRKLCDQVLRRFSPLHRVHHRHRTIRDGGEEPPGRATREVLERRAVPALRGEQGRQAERRIVGDERRIHRSPDAGGGVRHVRVPVDIRGRHRLRGARALVRAVGDGLEVAASVVDGAEDPTVRELHSRHERRVVPIAAREARDVAQRVAHLDRRAPAIDPKLSGVRDIDAGTVDLRIRHRRVHRHVAARAVARR